MGQILNITLDTCVWLELLKDSFYEPNSLFNEICYWIENKHVNHIAPQNIIKEWHRNKSNEQKRVIAHIKEREALQGGDFFKNNPEIKSTYQPDVIEEKIRERIEKVDNIFSNYSEIAPNKDQILLKAAARCLNEEPPNHKKESFRDSVNIFTLIDHLIEHGHSNSLFTTIDGDFNDGKRSIELHHELKKHFENADLSYVYFGNKKNVKDTKGQLGNLFIHTVLKKKPDIPRLFDYLKKQQEERDKRKLEEKIDQEVPATL